MSPSGSVVLYQQFGFTFIPLPEYAYTNGFALAVTLSERGLFTRQEWANTLGDEIKKAQAAGDPDTGETYYYHWLAALERIVAEKGIADPALLTRTRDAWHHACARTPHGLPIALTPSDFTNK